MSDDLFGDDNPLMRAATDVFSAAAAPSPLFAGTLGLVKADCARFTYYFDVQRSYSSLSLLRCI